MDSPISISDSSSIADLGPSALVSGSRRSLVGRLVTSPHAAATITSTRKAGATEQPGIAAILMAGDLGDRNDLRPLRPGDPIFATGSVEYVGQPVGLVVAETPEAAKKAAELIEVQYHPAPATLGVDHALALESFHGQPIAITRGDPATALEKAPYRLEGTLDIASQLPFPSEPLWVEVFPAENATLIVKTAAELPSRVRAAIGAAIDLPESHVEIVPLPIEGLVGGRQAETAYIATLAAMAVRKTGRPVRLELPREIDLALTAKRHAMKANYKVGYDEGGRVIAADIEVNLDGGHRIDDSDVALDQALLHSDGSYFIADCRVTGRLCRTNHVTGSAIPAEGAAQGAMIMEEILSRVAHERGLSPEAVRETNLYRASDNRHTTPYGQPVDSDPLLRTWQRLLDRAEIAERRKAIDRANAANPCYKRGLAVVPAKFGIGDPRPERNQAMALVQLLVDGSICVRLGCADAGDGLSRRVAEEAAIRFGVAADEVVVHCGDLHCTPHMCPRTGTDTVGLMRKAVADACQTLDSRLRPVAAQMLAATGVGAGEIDAENLRFSEGNVGTGAHADATISFGELIEAAWRRRTNMTAIGYYRTPNLWWDREVGAGWPFSGFVSGAAAVEVQLDAFTGEIQVLRADLVHQGSTLPDSGQENAQVARALQAGLGWMLHEKVDWHPDQASLTRDSARDYALPGFGEAPFDLDLEIIPSPNHPAEFYAASGAESAIFLASAAREAAREAIRAFGTPVDRKIEVELPAPASPAAVLFALREMSTRLNAAKSNEESEEKGGNESKS